MKKLTLLTMMAASMLALTACGKNTDNNQTVQESVITDEVIATEEETTESEDVTESNEDVANEKGDVLEILTNIWGAYNKEDQFAVTGGDYSEENMVSDAPGRYGLEDISMLDYTFGVPTEDAALIEDAASLIHMMNANTFTCGAFQITDSNEIEGFAERLRDGIQARQWMCGFPDVLLIAQIDDCVVSVFGKEENVETFKQNMESVYDVQILHEEPIL